MYLKISSVLCTLSLYKYKRNYLYETVNRDLENSCKNFPCQIRFLYQAAAKRKVFSKIFKTYYKIIIQIKNFKVLYKDSLAYLNQI